MIGEYSLQRWSHVERLMCAAEAGETWSVPHPRVVCHHRGERDGLESAQSPEASVRVHLADLAQHLVSDQREQPSFDG
jgi:hypothetical protein